MKVVQTSQSAYVLFLIIFCCILIGCEESDVKTFSIVMEITSEISPLTVTYEKHAVDAYTNVVSSFPWTKSFTAEEGDQILLWYRNNTSTRGTIRLSIKVDGEELYSSSCSDCLEDFIGAKL